MKVYKYYAPIDYNFDAIAKKYLFFCRANKLNDPFEANFKFKHYGIVPPTMKNEFERIEIDIQKTIGVCSFSKTPTNKALWALYADNYAGFVVEYDISSLGCMAISMEGEIPRVLDDGSKEVSDCPQGLLTQGDVGYCKFPKEKIEEYDIIAIDERDYRKIQLKDCNDQRNKDILISICLLQKDERYWQAEEEYRLIAGFHIEGQEVFNFYDSGYKIPLGKDIKVVSVTVGYNIEEQDIVKLQESFSKDPDVKFYRVFPNLKKCVLEQEEVK
ncbi:DUF2971 domain-containing protein [Porphyromonas levii]|uniref:DUF2971 domain-containing protein n=1 Tax=Porphyromonas levii TaxID=28114 RepID=UPI001BADE112|nr:DUF2971 domain-containing protein [Porphyromonas levii]MBR8803426.1 hypothetical protein [Porphyromonas levii]